MRAIVFASVHERQLPQRSVLRDVTQIHTLRVLLNELLNQALLNRHSPPTAWLVGVRCADVLFDLNGSIRGLNPIFISTCR